MIWNYSDKAALTMKHMSEEDIKKYLIKFQIKIYMLTMSIKYKERAEIYSLK